MRRGCQCAPPIIVESLADMPPGTRCIWSIAGLILVSLLVQWGVASRAAVSALDAVRFAQRARLIEEQGLVSALRSDPEQPLFSVWLSAVHQLAGRPAAGWASAAQWAAAVPLVLAVIPVYLIGRRLFGDRPALAGGLLFCVLPEVARLGADGISDGLHLLFFSLALWAMVEFWERVREADEAPSDANATSARGRNARLATVALTAGIAVGLGALTRSESVVLAGSFAIALAVAGWRGRRTPVAVGLAGFALGVAIAVLPYLVAVGALAPKPALHRLLGRGSAEIAEAPEPVEISRLQAIGDGSLAFDVKERSISLRRHGPLAAIKLFGSELADLFGIVGLQALFGLWRVRGTHHRPVDRFCRLFLLLYCGSVLYLAATWGYLSARHLLPVAVLGMGAAGAGAVGMGELLWRGFGLAGRSGSWGRSPAWIQGAIVLAAMSTCAVGLAQPLHISRAGHRQAAEWLMGPAASPGHVLDTRGWTSLYTDRLTYTYDQARTAFVDPQLSYVVLEREELAYNSPRSRTLERLLGLAARPAAEFTPRDPRWSTVVVYQWQPARFAAWLATASRDDAPPPACPAPDDSVL